MSRRRRASASSQNSLGGMVGVWIFTLCCGLSLVMLLTAPAVAARIVVSGAPALQPHLREWALMSLAAPLVALGLVRFVVNRGGRLLRRPWTKRWLGLAGRAGILLGVLNVVAFYRLMRIDSTEHDVSMSMGASCSELLVGAAVLVAIGLWDRRPEPVTVEQVRAVAADADRTLRRIRAENDRVRRQADQVQARVAKLRAHARKAEHRQPPRQRAKQQPSDVDFHALRVFHRESYQCADTAHLAFRSTQDSLHTLTSMVRRARYTPQHWLTFGHQARQARAELRAVLVHLQSSHGQLQTQVEQGLGTVRTLNANTSELKHEIRDSCGHPGREWFEALEQRVEEARAARR